MEKAAVASIFEEYASLLELKGENPFKSRAFQNAARVVGALDGDLDTLVRDNKLKGTPGLGETLLHDITELVTTGHLKAYDELKAEIPAGLQAMLHIPGLGPKRIKQIHDTLGIATITDLEAACQANKIAVLPGFGKKSQDNIVRGIQFLSQYQDHYLFPVAEAEAERIVAALKQLPGILRISIGGSLRRRKEIVHDIDVVASVTDDSYLGPIMDAFTTMPGVVAITGKGDKKSSVVLQPGIAMDLRLCTDDIYPTMLHHFTGSKEHNVALRGYAQDHGMKVSEWGLFKGETLLPVRDEKEFYATLGMDYIEPELREDRGEIQAALAHRMPGPLLTEKDLRGVLHCHSTWSDGQVSIKEMAEACIKLGYEYIGICDHSKTAAYAGGLNEDKVKQQQEEIDRLNAEYAGRFRILKGTECDILRDGALDFGEETLKSFDFVVASIHSLFNLPQEEQTKRLLRAMENPYTSIIGHPTGRILLGRDGYGLDMEAVIDRAGELGVCIEINANPLRLDLDWRWLRRAKEHGVKIPICPDAHNPGGLEDMRYGVNIARKGALSPADVPNTLGVDDLLAYFKRQRQPAGQVNT
ncbi:MAG TPA: DNA polymerase/3'-5' exonuclease PolX [Ktedonobacterales bacterium]|nr:DNA polymerase/3'-5' exonuclease PolX [Ktedonobacterales bacterium]